MNEARWTSVCLSGSTKEGRDDRMMRDATHRQNEEERRAHNEEERTEEKREEEQL